MAVKERERVLCANFITVVAVRNSFKRADVDDLRLCKHPCSVLLSEIEIVLVECVLGTVTAAEDAPPTLIARSPLGAFASEERIGHGLARQFSLAAWKTPTCVG